MSDDSDTGYGRPPQATRFQKGASGNPRGRPRGRHNTLPYETVLGQIVTVRENGVEQRMTAAEAFLLHMTKQGLEGNGAIGRATLTALEEARQARGVADDELVSVVVIKPVAPGSVAPTLEALGMATRHDAYRPTTRLMLQPWLVQAALERLGDVKLTAEQQAVVVKATRTPHKVRWPEWWLI
jgi:hypothetical protein